MKISRFLKKYEVEIKIIAFVFLIKLALVFWSYVKFDFMSFPWETIFSIWSNWDSFVYLSIAKTGYNFIDMKLDFWAFLSNFPPFYSILIIIISKILFLPKMISGIIISLLSIIFASIFLYKLTYLEFHDKKTAWLAVIFLNLYPTSYFTISVYSESLFILLSVLFFYLLKIGQYKKSSIFVSLAVLTRFVGIIMLPIYFGYIIKKTGFKLKSYLLIFSSSFGLLLYLLINKFYYGSYFYFFTEELSFDSTKYLIFPFSETIKYFILMIKKNEFTNFDFMMKMGWNSIFTLMAMIITIWGIGKIDKKYLIFSFGSILLFASLSWGISNARYTLSVFPLFMILAQIKNKYILVTILSSFIIGLFYFTTVFTGGTWAF